MKNVARATATVSTITFSNVIVGLARSKFTALVLGTAGVGLFSQALNFLQFAIVIASLSMRLGVTKYVSRYFAEKEDIKVAETISLAAMMQTLVGLFLIVIITAFAGTVSRLLFASADYKFFVFLLSLGIPFVVLSGTLESVLLGLGNYRSFAKGRVIATFLSLIPLFALVGLMKIKGAFFYLLANSLISFFVFYYITYNFLLFIHF